MAKAPTNQHANDEETVVVTGLDPVRKPGCVYDKDGNELVRVEAITFGTYPDKVDPRREPWYAVPREGRVFNAETGRFSPGEVFWMTVADAATAVPDEKGHGGWVRILKDGELPQAMAQGEAPIPATTAPRGYGQGRRPGVPPQA